MLATLTQPSEAQRLTTLFRARSTHGTPYGSRSALAEERQTLQMVIDGGVLRQRFLSDGRRQTIAVYYRDDVINLSYFAGGGPTETDYLLALKGTVIGSLDDDAVRTMRAEAEPGLDGIGALLGRELRIARESLVSLGQRSAMERAAHFFCETLLRCVGLAEQTAGRRCNFEMTLEVLATVLGISAVHASRVMQELRSRGLAELTGHELIVHDFARLAEAGCFDDAYLAPS